MKYLPFEKNVDKNSLLKEMEDYFQNPKIRKLLEKYFSCIMAIGSFTHEGRTTPNSDIDITFFKKKDVPVGEYLINQTKLIKDLSKNVIAELGVLLSAFPKQAVQEESVEFSKLYSTRINKGLKTDKWEDLYGIKLTPEEITYWKDFLKNPVRNVIGLHNLNYCRLKDFETDTICPRKFREEALKGTILSGDADKIKDLEGELTDEEIKIYMTLQDFNMIPTAYPPNLLRQKLGHGIDYINKHVLGNNTNLRQESLTREGITQEFFKAMNNLDNRIAANA